MALSTLNQQQQNSRVKLAHVTKHSSPNEPVEVIFSVTDADQAEQTYKATIDSRELYQVARENNMVKQYGSHRIEPEQADHVVVLHITKTEEPEENAQMAFLIRDRGFEWIEVGEFNPADLYQVCNEKGWIRQPSSVRRFSPQRKTA